MLEVWDLFRIFIVVRHLTKLSDESNLFNFSVGFIPKLPIKRSGRTCLHEQILERFDGSNTKTE
jgi:hypothetical protein